MVGTLAGRGKALVGHQLRASQVLAQQAELAVVAHGQEDRRGARGKAVVGIDVGMGVARAPWRPAAHEPVARMRVQQRDAAVVQRDIDQLAQAAALALLQRQQHADDAVHARDHVHHRQAHAQRIAAGLAVDAHQPRHGLDGRVIAGPGAQRAIGAEAADAAPDEARKALAHLLPANAPFLHGADLEVLHHHVGLLHQRQHGLLAFGLGQVQELQPLVAVQAPVVGGHTVLERRPPGARIVALRRLHLEHVGAVVAQDLAAQRATKNAGEVEDTDALERSRALICVHGDTLVSRASRRRHRPRPSIS